MLGDTYLTEHNLALDPGTLRKGYSEAGGAYQETDLGIPRKSEVAWRYVETVRTFDSAPKVKISSLPPNISGVPANNRALFADLSDD